MFVDEVTVEVRAGDGGNGAVAFRKEMFVPRGGPAGGDGGKGGDVILEADSNLSTLLDFRYQRVYPAQRGGDGAAKDMIGKNGEDLLLKVPIGTVAYDADSGHQVADLLKHAERAVISRGGQGGRGNAHFSSSTHQAPRFAENGEPGQTMNLRLEIKLLADVGLVGFPNVGKSSLIAAVSAARPKIANYPFTTLVPNLGVVRVDDDPTRTMVMADIPGLVEGASEGIGLGHRFLRHIERTRMIVHMIDVGGLTGRDPIDDYAVINRELAAHSEKLAKLPQVIALNKVDIAPPDEVKRLTAHFRDAEGVEVFPISAATGEGVKPLLYRLADRLSEIAREVPEIDADAPVLITVGSRPKKASRRYDVSYDAAISQWVVKGAGIERLVAMTPLDNEHAVERLQRTMDKAGIYRKLKAQGAKEGDTVRIGKSEFDYTDEDPDEE